MNETPTFTDRQLEVIRLLDRGMNAPEIAAELEISPRTVRAHADTIRHKLGVARRAQIPHAYRVLMGSRLAS